MDRLLLPTKQSSPATFRALGKAFSWESLSMLGRLEGTPRKTVGSCHHPAMLLPHTPQRATLGWLSTLGCRPQAHCASPGSGRVRDLGPSRDRVNVAMILPLSKLCSGVVPMMATPSFPSLPWPAAQDSRVHSDKLPMPGPSPV